ncbi:MAG: hypothetical protein EON55_24140 [Alphaproteobacteria bacterium]|nr:MAG: hypothetical protein EON55_24140 [Alphaproteobacteria bacterium]
MLPRTTSIWQRDSQPNASGEPGAVQCQPDDDRQVVQTLIDGRSADRTQTRQRSQIASPYPVRKVDPGALDCSVELLPTTQGASGALKFAIRPLGLSSAGHHDLAGLLARNALALASHRCLHRRRRHAGADTAQVERLG